MRDEDAKRFLEELEDCDGDIAAWNERKQRENNSFCGFEINPEKKAKLNRLNTLCKKLAALDHLIAVEKRPTSPEERSGMVAVIFPEVYAATDSRVSALMAQIFAEADDFTISAIESDEDGEIRSSGKVRITFCVMNMWSVYGKAPF